MRLKSINYPPKIIIIYHSVQLILIGRYWWEDGNVWRDTKLSNSLCLDLFILERDTDTITFFLFFLSFIYSALEKFRDLGHKRKQSCVGETHNHFLWLVSWVVENVIWQEHIPLRVGVVIIGNILQQLY